MKMKLLQFASVLLASFTPQGIAQNPQKVSVKPEVLETLRRHGVEKILFVTRATNGADHYYTEYLLGSWAPNNSICSLDLKTGTVQKLVPQLKGGMFERFDVSFDAKRVVFAYRATERVGYRIYEINVDGTGMRQLTFPPPDEDERIKKFGSDRCTDDMQPCYLPDGGIVFISTRCQYGILCNPPDIFTTTVLYRMDADGQNLRKLSNSSVSEASPGMLPDGRIMYTRWEYVDKGAVSVKGLWAMKPDGTASTEIFGNDIALPPTKIYGRAIPGAPNQYVVLGTPHSSWNTIGTVIRLDMTKNIRTREPMTYMTPDVDVREERGWAFKTANGDWQFDNEGKGRLFRDPYPLSENLFLVAHKLAGPRWSDTKAYGLYLLNEKGEVENIYTDPDISCWLPYPLKPRPTPPVLISTRNAKLAEAKQAACMVTDVYSGLEDVPRGTIKYIRVLEQIPRPWAVRHPWDGDEFDQQYSCVSKHTHLGLKVQHGVVPVEDDGSANFVVPAEANIFFQVLDANYMAVQTERTFVNYMPGEVRGCVGCHETPANVSRSDNTALVRKALKRPPSIPGAQPGEQDGHRALDYAHDVQPVFDKYCQKCHSGAEPKGNLNLSGTLTELFNVSYETLLPSDFERRYSLLGLIIAENVPKTGNVDYLPAKSLGSHTSVLVAMLSKGKVKLADPKKAERAAKLAEVHKNLKLAPEELLKITNWIDTNGQYYGTYWGRKNLKYKDHPQFRIYPTFETATSMTSPVPEEQR